jgi:hypothetical protein
MLKSLMDQTRSLGNVEIKIAAQGRYPTKQKTRVQDVAVYQNNGTATIDQSQFVQRAEKANRQWLKPLQHAVSRWLFYADIIAMNKVAKIINQDIVIKIDRVDTGRLRASMKGTVNMRS